MAMPSAGGTTILSKERPDLLGVLGLLQCGRRSSLAAISRHLWAHEEVLISVLWVHVNLF